MKTIQITVANKNFSISLNDDFAQCMDEDFHDLFFGEERGDIKKLLHAYIQKSYDLYQMQQEIDTLLDQLNEELQ